MGLIGLATVSLVAMILWVRSEQVLNKTGVGALYLIYAIYATGVSI